MDGETALMFVRSRHADGFEGTDTAREARQQKVIDGIKEKIKSPLTFISPKVDFALINIANKYIETDIDSKSTGVIARKVVDASKNISQTLIPQELQTNPPESSLYDGQYVFIPRIGNGRWEEIRSWVSSLLK